MPGWGRGAALRPFLVTRWYPRAWQGPVILGGEGVGQRGPDSQNFTVQDFFSRNSNPTRVNGTPAWTPPPPVGVHTCTHMRACAHLSGGSISNLVGPLGLLCSGLQAPGGGGGGPVPMCSL